MVKIITLVILLMLNSCFAYAGGIPTLAVLNFSARNVPEDSAVIITDFVRETIVRTKKFKVLERENMEYILYEQKFQVSGCTTQECAVKTGKLLNVQQMVTGSLARIGEDYYISARIVDVTDGTIKVAETGECRALSGLKRVAEIVGIKLSGFDVQELPFEGSLSAEGRDGLERILKVLNISRDYYKREIRTSWIVVSLGMLLAMNGLLWFEGSDRVVFGVLSLGLTGIGATSLQKNNERIGAIERDINATTVRINLSF